MCAFALFAVTFLVTFITDQSYAQDAAAGPRAQPGGQDGRAVAAGLPDRFLGQAARATRAIPRR